MDWQAIEREAVDLLSEYLRIDTTNPPGNERRAIEFLKDFLKQEGLEAANLEKTRSVPNLICRLTSGKNRKGLMLLHHCDVVGADPREWTVPPFGGIVKDGYVYGRGALDMKGMGIMELMAFVLAKRENLPLRKDLVLVVCCDEETGSKNGAEFLAKNHAPELEAAWLLNEGGSGWKTGDWEAVLLGFGEKGPLWLRLVAEGKAGHGSVPHGQNPCETLLAGLSALKVVQRPLRVLPEMQALLKNLGLSDVLGGFGRPSSSADPTPAGHVPGHRERHHASGRFQAERDPARAEATLDLRILPAGPGRNDG